MALMTGLMSMLFGDGRNVLAETAEVFRANEEHNAQRAADHKKEVLQQFAAEFAKANTGLFDRLVDGLNRLPRPMLALGTIALFVSAMSDPVWFASRMEGIALVPEPLWWLMGAIVSFYFGARHQAKGQEFQRSVVQTVALSHALSAPQAEPPETDDNAALAEWEAQGGRTR
jgi:hypothetical protein